MNKIIIVSVAILVLIVVNSSDANVILDRINGTNVVRPRFPNFPGFQLPRTRPSPLDIWRRWWQWKDNIRNRNGNQPLPTPATRLDELLE